MFPCFVCNGLGPVNTEAKGSSINGGAILLNRFNWDSKINDSIVIRHIDI
jgi:hypothetical protein